MLRELIALLRGQDEIGYSTPLRFFESEQEKDDAMYALRESIEHVLAGFDNKNVTINDVDVTSRVDIYSSVERTPRIPTPDDFVKGRPFIDALNANYPDAVDYTHAEPWHWYWWLDEGVVKLFYTKTLGVSQEVQEAFHNLPVQNWGVFTPEDAEERVGGFLQIYNIIAEEWDAETEYISTMVELNATQHINVTHIPDEDFANIMRVYAEIAQVCDWNDIQHLRPPPMGAGLKRYYCDFVSGKVYSEDDTKPTYRAYLTNSSSPDVFNTVVFKYSSFDPKFDAHQYIWEKVTTALNWAFYDREYKEEYERGGTGVGDSSEYEREIFLAQAKKFLAPKQELVDEYKIIDDSDVSDLFDIYKNATCVFTLTDPGNRKYLDLYGQFFYPNRPNGFCVIVKDENGKLTPEFCFSPLTSAGWEDQLVKFINRRYFQKYSLSYERFYTYRSEMTNEQYDQWLARLEAVTTEQYDADSDIPIRNNNPLKKPEITLEQRRPYVPPNDHLHKNARVFPRTRLDPSKTVPLFDSNDRNKLTWFIPSEGEYNRCRKILEERIAWIRHMITYMDPEAVPIFKNPDQKSIWTFGFDVGEGVDASKESIVRFLYPNYVYTIAFTTFPDGVPKVVYVRPPKEQDVYPDLQPEFLRLVQLLRLRLELGDDSYIAVAKPTLYSFEMPIGAEIEIRFDVDSKNPHEPDSGLFRAIVAYSERIQPKEEETIVKLYANHNNEKLIKAIDAGEMPNMDTVKDEDDDGGLRPIMDRSYRVTYPLPYELYVRNGQFLVFTVDAKYQQADHPLRYAGSLNIDIVQRLGMIDWPQSTLAIDPTDPVAVLREIHTRRNWLRYKDLLEKHDFTATIERPSLVRGVTHLDPLPATNVFVDSILNPNYIHKDYRWARTERNRMEAEDFPIDPEFEFDDSRREVTKKNKPIMWSKQNATMNDTYMKDVEESFSEGNEPVEEKPYTHNPDQDSDETFVEENHSDDDSESSED